MSSRIHQYEATEDAYRGWVNSIILIFHFQYERPINFTPLIRQGCRAMFQNDIPAAAAAKWIAQVHGFCPLSPAQRRTQVDPIDEHGDMN